MRECNPLISKSGSVKNATDDNLVITYNPMNGIKCN